MKLPDFNAPMSLPESEVLDDLERRLDQIALRRLADGFGDGWSCVAVRHIIADMRDRAEGRQG